MIQKPVHREEERDPLSHLLKQTHRIWKLQKNSISKRPPSVTRYFPSNDLHCTFFVAPSWVPFRHSTVLRLQFLDLRKVDHGNFWFRLLLVSPNLPFTFFLHFKMQDPVFMVSKQFLSQSVASCSIAWQTELFSVDFLPQPNGFYKNRQRNYPATRNPPEDRRASARRLQRNKNKLTGPNFPSSH